MDELSAIYDPAYNALTKVPCLRGLTLEQVEGLAQIAVNATTSFMRERYIQTLQQVHAYQQRDKPGGDINAQFPKSPLGNVVERVLTAAALKDDVHLPSDIGDTLISGFDLRSRN